MKLSALHKILHENLVAQIEDELNSFPIDQDTIEAIINFLKAFNGFKLKESSITDEISIEITNNIVDVWLHIIKETQDMFTISAQVSVVDGLLAVPTGVQAIKSLGDSLRKTEDRVCKELEYMQNRVPTIAENFTEWYFDVSGEYGKLKIFIQPANSKVYAVGGRYDVDSDEGTTF